MAQPQRVVLVVDDEPQMPTLLKAILVQAGFAIVSAVDGQDALDLSRTYPDSIDLVVSDILMPRMTGPELAEHLHSERPNTRVLLMSGHASDALLDYACSHDLIQEPFEPKKFIQRVTDAMTRPMTGAAV